MQAIGFQVLQRGGAGDRFKVMVERRDAHIRFRRQLIDAEVLCVLAFNTLQYAANQAEVGLTTDQRQQRPPARPGQHVIENFADNLFAKNARVQRALHDIQQALRRAQYLFGQHRRVDPARRHGRLKLLIFPDIHQQFLQLKNIDVQPNPRQRDFRSGEGFAFKRQWYRQQQILIGVIAKGTLVNVANFMPGKEKNDPRLIHNRRARPRLGTVQQANIRQQSIKHFFFIFQLINLMR